MTSAQDKATRWHSAKDNPKICLAVCCLPFKRRRSTWIVGNHQQQQPWRESDMQVSSWRALPFALTAVLRHGQAQVSDHTAGLCVDQRNLRGGAQFTGSHEPLMIQLQRSKGQCYTTYSFLPQKCCQLEKHSTGQVACDHDSECVEKVRRRLEALHKIALGQKVSQAKLASGVQHPVDVGDIEHSAAGEDLR